MKRLKNLFIGTNNIVLPPNLPTIVKKQLLTTHLLLTPVGRLRLIKLLMSVIREKELC